MGFKRLRDGEQRDGEMAGNEEVVEIETGNDNTTQNQTQLAQRGTTRSRPEWMIRCFMTPPARRAENAEGVRTRTPGKQAALSAVGIEVTPVVGSGTANKKEARNYVNKGNERGDGRGEIKQLGTG
jgi:hypothetical protein